MAKRRTWIQRLASAISQHLFVILCWLALPALVIELVRRYYLHGQATLKELVILGLIFLLAFVAQTGAVWVDRLKKVGPVEFYERSAGAQAQLLKPIRLEVPADADLHRVAPALTPERHYAFEKAQTYLVVAEQSGLMAAGKKHSKELYELMLRVATIAIGQSMWPLATERLEQLEALSEGAYRAAEVRYKCGLAYCLWAKASGPEEEIKLCGKAESWLRRAIDAGEASAWPHRQWAYFWLAYAEISLGRFQLAIRHNADALRLQANMAPAKYNMAISWIKLGNLRRAYRTLLRIQREDEDLEQVARGAPDDEELKALKTAPEHREAMAVLLQEWEGWVPADDGSAEQRGDR